MATPDNEEISDKEKVRICILCLTGSEISRFQSWISILNGSDVAEMIQDHGVF